MNKLLQEFARSNIKKGLSKLPEKYHHSFKRMYSPKNLELPINEVVDKMPEGKLDWAMRQIENSLEKLGLSIK